MLKDVYSKSYTSYWGLYFMLCGSAVQIQQAQGTVW